MQQELNTELEPSVRETNRRRLFIVIMVLGMFCLSGPARAIEYGAHVAYGKPADSDKGNYWVGGQIEFRPLPAFGVEGAVDYRSRSLYGTNFQDGRSVKVTSVPVTLTGHLYLPMPSSFSPYLLAGAGWYRVNYDFSDAFERELGFHDQSVSTFGWHLGAGAKLALVPNFYVSAEARYVFADPAKKLGQDVRNEIRNLDYNSVYYGAGIGFRF